MTYKFERVSKKNLIDLLPIFEDAFGEAPTLTELKAKHSTEFTGFSNMGYIAYDKIGMQCAYYGVFPVLISINGEISVAVQSGDTMVSKKHKRRGLFTDLAEKTYKLCKESKIHGVFGFPLPEANVGFTKKLKWLNSGNINKYQFIIFTIPLALACARIGVLSRLYSLWVNFILRFFKKGDVFPSSILKEGLDGIYRSKEYWNYKLQNKNVKIIEVLNKNVLLKFGTSLEIGDVEYDDLKELVRIIGKLKFLCAIIGINRLVFYVSPNTKINEDFSKICKPTTGLPIGYLNFDNQADLKKLKYTYSDMDTF